MGGCFHDYHRVRLGDTLQQVAEGHGYRSAGPIVFYPQNRSVFQPVLRSLERGTGGEEIVHSRNFLRPDTVLLIPFQREVLRLIIDAARDTKAEIAREATTLIRDQRMIMKEAEDFLFKLDLLAFLASLGASKMSMIGQGLESAAAPSLGNPKAMEMSSREVLVFLADHGVGRAATMATAVIPTPVSPRRDHKWLVRHTIGIWNPSYWTTAAAAVVERDVDIYSFGTAAIAHREAMHIKRLAESRMEAVRGTIRHAEEQLQMSFYWSFIRPPSERLTVP